MQKRKITILTANTQGGGAAHILELISRMERSEFQIDFIAPDNGPYWAPIVERADSSWRVPFRRKKLISFFLIFVRLVRNRPDVLHTHGRGAGYFGRLLGGILGISVLHTFHGIQYGKYSNVKRRFFYKLEAILARFTQQHICVSDSEYKAVTQLKLAPPAKCCVIKNGVDFKCEISPRTSIRRELGIDENIKIIVSISRISPEKRIEDIINAHAQLSFEAELLIVGGVQEGAERYSEMLLDLTKSRKKVHFLGNRSDVLDILKEADLFITSSLWEGLPLTPLESVRVKTPVLASKISPHREILGEEECQYFEPQDASTLKERIEYFYLNPDLFKRISEKNYVQAEQEFNVDKMAFETMNLYRS